MRPSPAPTGFTLLETLVALTIVAIGFAAAFGAMPESLGAQAKAANLEGATSLAQSVLAQSGAAQFGPAGNLRTGGAEGRYAWHLDSALVESARPRQPGEFGGTIQRVTVQWTEGGNLRHVQLQTIRLGFP